MAFYYEAALHANVTLDVFEDAENHRLIPLAD
jgi:hypothetical protein